MSASQVRWDRLVHAYGPAGDVPALLAALTSRDAQARDAAMWKLWGNVFHQGTRYQATPFVVPAVVDALRDPLTLKRSELVEFLLHLAVGYPEEWLSTGFDPEPIRMAQAEMADNEFGVEEIASYDAVCAHGAALTALLRDADRSVRAMTGYLLAFLPDVAKVSTPALLSSVVNDADADVAASSALAISYLSPSRDFDGRSVTAALRMRRSFTARFAAACLDASPPQTAPPGALDALLDALASEPIDRERFPWNEGDLAGLAAVILGRAPLSNAALEAILDRLRSAVWLPALTLARVALADQFPTSRPVPSDAHDLRPAQRRVVDALCTASGWRIDGGNFANFSLLVAGHGLPGTDADCRRWLRGADLADCRPPGRRWKPGRASPGAG